MTDLGELTNYAITEIWYCDNGPAARCLYLLTPGGIKRYQRIWLDITDLSRCADWTWTKPDNAVRVG